MLLNGLVGKNLYDHSMVLLDLNLSSVPMGSNAELGTRTAKLRPTRLSNDPINFGRRSQTWSQRAKPGRWKHTAACVAFQTLLHRDGERAGLKGRGPVWRKSAGQSTSMWNQRTPSEKAKNQERNPAATAAQDSRRYKRWQLCKLQPPPISNYSVARQS